MKTSVMKKKPIFLLSCLVLLFCLAACSQSDNTEALTKWYNGKARTQIEQQINDAYKAQGLTFFITVEEPDTIVYNYQYNRATYSYAADERDILVSLLKQSSNALGTALKSDIAQYKDIYKLPVKILRVAYLDPDGDVIFTMDVDENFEPSDDASGQYSTLKEWLGSEDKETFISTLNASLEGSGVIMDFGADGDTLLLIYRFVEQLDLSDYTEEELDTLKDYFIDTIASSSGSDVTTMSDYLEAVLGFKIKDMRIQIQNADSALICDIPASDLK